MCGEVDENQEPRIKTSYFSEIDNKNFNLSVVYLIP